MVEGDIWGHRKDQEDRDRERSLASKRPLGDGSASPPAKRALQDRTLQDRTASPAAEPVEEAANGKDSRSAMHRALIALLEVLYPLRINIPQIKCWNLGTQGRRRGRGPQTGQGEEEGEEVEGGEEGKEGEEAAQEGGTGTARGLRLPRQRRPGRGENILDLQLSDFACISCPLKLVCANACRCSRPHFIH